MRFRNRTSEQERQGQRKDDPIASLLRQVNNNDQRAHKPEDGTEEETRKARQLTAITFISPFL
ncbi:hypothetical protein C6Y14_12375 [Streptomyces dioscori]|uniref:Uncharacterized protein n=1 Tax=Streptomyces dioscori TaxID=2109333 RepID=A0A2P8Q9P5_9ACTN|nr:hypothetical protein [Streptomyces dioscori]PSM42970.1 hypothetical protein C6Y14_12375 [Streptomyces dioscori]